MDETSHTRRYTRRRESWGAKRKLPSGRYQASYLGPDGERYTGPQTFDTLGDARAWLNSVKRKIDAGKWKNPRALAAERFGEYATAYVVQGLGREGKPFSPKTRRTYEWYLEVPLQAFKEERLNSITPAMVRAWHAARMKNTPTSAAREASFMHAVFERAVRDDLVEKNPVDPELRKTKTGVKNRIPTLDELALMLEWFAEHKPQLAAWLWLAAYGTLRKSEVRALRRQDLVKVTPDPGDIAQDYYEVHVTRQAYRVGDTWYVGEPKSEAGQRVAALPPALTPILDAHLVERTGRFKNALLFPAEGQGDFLDDSSFYRPWAKARAYAGLHKGDATVRLHDLRGLALTLYAQTSATQREIQARGGHSTIAAAARYQHTTGRDAMLAAQLPMPPSTPRRPASLDAARARRQEK